jgi:glyoxylase-like metal-dependent hydrolase (beta-lactamase superfamily II)
VDYNSGIYVMVLFNSYFFFLQQFLLFKHSSHLLSLHHAVKVIHTPGHTNTHHGLHFDCGGLSIVIAGDSVATQDFFHERRGYFNAVDFELSARTMDKLAAMADIIVPGHDNYFLADCVV